MLKKISICAFVLLTGCSMLSPRTFDSVEYNYAVKSTVDSARLMLLCKEKENHNNEFFNFEKTLNLDTMYFFEYEKHKPANTELMVDAGVSRYLFDSIYTRPKYSEKYCEYKYAEIRIMARTAARDLGGGSSFDMCKTLPMLQDRQKQYALLLANKEITESEYNDLNKDMDLLTKTDLASCKYQKKQTFANNVQTIWSGLGIFQSVTPFL